MQKRTSTPSALLSCLLLLVCAAILSACVQTSKPNAIISLDDPLLLENRWQLLEYSYSGEKPTFDLLGPVYVTFPASNWLSFSTKTCNRGLYQLAKGTTVPYVVTEASETFAKCRDDIERQYRKLFTAINSIHQIENAGEQLFLIGDETRLVLKLNNEQ